MLQDKAMIVRLSISQWTARRYDRTVSERVNDEYNTTRDAGRYNKLLIAKGALDSITVVAGEARTYHYNHTLPWDDAGGRLLPSAHFTEYAAAIRALHSRFDEAVKNFCENYSVYVGDAKLALGRMFEPHDYPSVHEIARRYAFNTDIMPIPTSDDFRITLGADELSEIKSALEANVQEREEKAYADLYLRLATVVQRFAEKIAVPGAIFRDSLVGNIVELANLLPALNLGNDPKLEALRKEALMKLGSLEPQTLRDDTRVRENAAADAQAIMSKLSAYGFGPKEAVAS